MDETSSPSTIPGKSGATTNESIDESFAPIAAESVLSGVKRVVIVAEESHLPLLSQINGTDDDADHADGLSIDTTETEKIAQGLRPLNANSKIEDALSQAIETDHLELVIGADKTWLPQVTSPTARFKVLDKGSGAKLLVGVQQPARPNPMLRCLTLELPEDGAVLLQSSYVFARNQTMIYEISTPTGKCIGNYHRGSCSPGGLLCLCLCFCFPSTEWALVSEHGNKRVIISGDFYSCKDRTIFKSSKGVKIAEARGQGRSGTEAGISLAFEETGISLEEKVLLIMICVSLMDHYQVKYLDMLRKDKKVKSIKKSKQTNKTT